MSLSSLDIAIQKAADLLQKAQHAVAFTGAGISTPSGIPDFRSKNTGLWQRFDPMEVASLDVFQARPARFYDWLRPLLRQTWQAQPNPAHLALAELEKAGCIKAVVTQNIDDLHQRAGSNEVLEVHGSLRTLTCRYCSQTYPSTQFREKLTLADDMPTCPTCAHILKPDIVLFGEILPSRVWRAAEEHCQQADIILVVGSSLEVWPAASLPEMGVENGASLIINNLTPTHLDPFAAACIPLNVAEALPQIASLILQAR
jgi:NAD-dependent deacetylase